jgi:7-cyano-7-deazaguanine synthase
MSSASSESRPKSRRAVCLLSGGLDSSTCLALARRDFDCYALSFDYGQRHRIELEAAAHVAHALGAKEHRTAKVDLRAFGGSALTADELAVPKRSSLEDTSASEFSSVSRSLTSPRATRSFSRTRLPGRRSWNRPTFS